MKKNKHFKITIWEEESKSMGASLLAIDQFDPDNRIVTIYHDSLKGEKILGTHMTEEECKEITGNKKWSNSNTRFYLTENSVKYILDKLNNQLK